MAKKMVRVFVPFTEDEWLEFARLWNKAKETAENYSRIASLEYEIAKEVDRRANGVTWIEGFDHVSDKGMYGWEMQPARYDEGYERADVFIPLPYILNPTPYHEEADKGWEKYNAKRAKQTDDWERQTYERLKEKFQNE